MKTGPRIGPRIGPNVGRFGLASSSGLSASRDATSLKYVPANSSEWSSVMTAASLATGNPSSLWLLQEASGSPADSIGANALTPFGAPSYQNSVSGWTRKAVNTTSSADCFYQTSLGDITSSSKMLLLYVAFGGTPSSAKRLITMGTVGTNSRQARLNTTPRWELTGDNAQATGTGGSSPGTTVHPLILQVDRTNSRMAIVTDQEQVLPAYTAPAGAGTYLSIGPDGGTADATTPVSILYAAYFTGAAAQLTAAQTRTLLQTLGWTVAW